MALFDHPSNPRHPSCWYVLQDPGFGFINPAFLLNEAFSLPARATLRLRYRVLVHDDWGKPEDLEAEFERFAEA